MSMKINKRMCAAIITSAAMIIAAVPAVCASGAEIRELPVADVGSEPIDNLDVALSQAIISSNIDSYGHIDNAYPTEAHVVLKTVEDDGGVTVYAYALSTVYTFEGGKLREAGGSSMPVSITFDIDDFGTYRLAEYWIPDNGAYYMSSIQGKFPKDIWDKVDTQLYAGEQILVALRKAQQHFGVTDCTKPEITVLKPLVIAKGTKPDWSEYFRITDDVDGEIPISQAHYWDSFIDFDKPGKYDGWWLIVEDSAGNENRSAFEITVK